MINIDELHNYLHSSMRKYINMPVSSNLNIMIKNELKERYKDIPIDVRNDGYLMYIDIVEDSEIITFEINSRSLNV